MASSTGKWETVVNKKKSHVTKSDVKKAQQKFIDGDKVPKIGQNDPLQLDDTMYAAGFKKHVSDEEQEKYPSRLNYESEEKSSPRNVSRKKDKKAPKPVPAVFDMAGKIRKIDAGRVSNLIKETEAKFPKQNLIWLKYVTGWLQTEIGGPNEKTDIAYLNKPADYPICELTEEVRNILRKLIRKCDTNTLNAFFVFLVAALTTEAQQFHSTIGYRIMIQLLYNVQPNILVDSCDEVVHGKARNADSYLAVMWAFSQVTNHLENGLFVWWSCMFSVLDKKYHAVAAIQYFDTLMSLYDSKKNTKALITTDQMVQLMEVMVSEKSPLQHTPGLMDQMRIHFKTLTKMLLCGDNAKSVFQQLLPALRQCGDTDMKYMLCEVLLECLHATSSTMAWWQESVTHCMKETSILLKYIQTKPNELNKFSTCRQYKSKYVLLDCSTVMLANLDKANERGKMEKKAAFKDCRRICNSFIRTELARKNKGSTFIKILKFAFVALLLLAVADIYQSTSYRESHVGVYLKRYGVEDNALFVMEYAKEKSDVATSFIGKHAPCVYSKVSYYLDPVIEVSSKYIVIASSFVYKHSQPIRMYLNRVVPPLLEKVSYFMSEQYRIISVFVSATFNKYSPMIQESILSTYSWLCVSIPQAFHYTVHLMSTAKQQIYQLHPVFFDSLRLYLDDMVNYVVKVTPVFMESLRNYTTTCADVTQLYLYKGQTWLKQNLVNPTSSK